MKAYKGFNKDMTCRDFQFEEGETYKEHEAILCRKGFHACEHPLGCFNYYPPANSVYHEVELEDVSEERESDTKVVAKKITVGARLDIAGMVKAEVDFVFAKADWSKKENHATGDQGAAISIGYNGKAKAAIGCWITLAEWEIKNSKAERIDIQTKKVDGEQIKADTWYQLKGGQFVEVK